MALFLGGPADGWRIEVDTTQEKVVIPVNPHPPAFTPDVTVLTATTSPGYEYKREQISCDLEDYIIYVPLNWNCTDIIDALIMGYKPDKDRERIKYVRSAEGQLYSNDDRIAAGRPYKLP